MLGSAEIKVRRNRVRAILLTGVMAVTAASCTHEFSTEAEVSAARQATMDKQVDILEKRGVTGRLKLSYIRAGSEVRSESQSSGSLNGELKGLYFLVAAGVDGELDAESSSTSVIKKDRLLLLAWTTNSDIPITTPQYFPLELVQVVESPGLETPEVEFGINISQLVYLGDRANPACWYDEMPEGGKRPGYQPERCMTTTDSNNMNDIIKPEDLSYVRLFLNPDTAAEFYAQVGNS